jgi:hypothetical protein
MIELIIDFNKCPSKKKDFILCLCDKFNIAPVFGWDAFSDNLSDIFIKEIPPDYKYDPNDEWGWSSYEDYENYVAMDRSTGLKGESGYREDLRVVFINFYDFYYKYKNIATTLLDYMLDTYASIKEQQLKRNEEDELLKFELCIKS